MSLAKSVTNSTTAGIVLAGLVVVVVSTVTALLIQGTSLRGAAGSSEKGGGVLGGSPPGVTENPSSQEPSKPSTSGLGETSWRLVKFQGADGKTLTPDDRAKYTIAFAPGGRLTARVDCNRGRGTWLSNGGNHIEFSPLSLTRVKCPDDSLHDQIVKHWTDIRSYAIKGGHLFLSLVADSGTYEFEPVTTK